MSLKQATNYQPRHAILNICVRDAVYFMSFKRYAKTNNLRVKQDCGKR